jgi:hypothetical protein
MDALEGWLQPGKKWKFLLNGAEVQIQKTVWSKRMFRQIIIGSRLLPNLFFSVNHF